MTLIKTLAWNNPDPTLTITCEVPLITPHPGKRDSADVHPSPTPDSSPSSHQVWVVSHTIQTSPLRLTYSGTLGRVSKIAAGY